MEKVLFPQGTKLSLTTSIEESQVKGRINLDRRLKATFEDFGILTRVVSGLTPDIDFQVINNPLDPSGSVLVNPGVALANQNDFGIDGEVYFLYNLSVTSVNIPISEEVYRLFAVWSGQTHTVTPVVNGFFYSTSNNTVNTRLSDSLKWVLSTDPSYDPETMGVYLADVTRSGLTLTVEDKRIENVLQLRSDLLDENLILKKDRDNTLSGTLTCDRWLSVLGNLFVANITAPVGYDIPITIPNGQRLVVYDKSANTITYTSDSEVCVVSGITLTVFDAVINSLIVSGLSVTQADVNSLNVAALENPGGDGSNIGLPGVRHYPFRIGVGLVGPVTNPLGGLEVVTEDPAPPVPAGLDFVTGIIDDEELPPNPNYNFFSEGGDLWPTSNAGGRGGGNPSLSPKAWIKAWFGTYGVGGQPDGTYSYRVSPSPEWTSNEWIGQIASIYYERSLIGHYLVSGNTANTIFFTQGSGFPDPPVSGAHYYIGPNAYEYQWKIVPLEPETMNPHVWGGGGFTPKGNNPFTEEAETISVSSSTESPVRQLALFTDLKPGVTYGIKVRSKSKTGNYSAWSDGGGLGGWMEVIAGMTDAIEMPPVTAEPIMAGLRLSWPRAQNPQTKEYAKGYQIVWTDDTTAPDFGNKSQPHEVCAHTTFDLKSRPGRTIKARVRAFTRGLRLSENSSYVEGTAGGTESAVQDKHLTAYLYKDPDIHNTETSRIVLQTSLNESIIIKDLQVTLYRWLTTDPEYQECKIRTYVSSPTRGISLLTDKLGFSEVTGNLMVPGKASLTIDAWDGTPSSLLTGFEGMVTVTYVYADLLDPLTVRSAAITGEASRL